MINRILSSPLAISALLFCNLWVAGAFSSTAATTKTTATTDSSSSTVDVAIVGAGPSGLCLAHSLLDRGYSVKVLERRTTFRPVGSAVFLHPFALNSLRNLSPTVFDNVLNVATPVGTVTVKSTTNENNKALFDQLDQAPEVFGNPFVTIRFWDLLQGLRKGLPEDIFCFGSEVQGYEQTLGETSNQRVRVTYRSTEGDETNSVNAKMVIDASGIRSQIRKQMQPNSQSVPFCKAYMAVLPADKANPIIKKEDRPEETMTERELGFLVGDVDGMTLATLKNGDVWWTYTYFDDDLDSSLSQNELVDRVKDRFPPFVEELFRATEDRIETVIADLPVSWKWGDGMVTLLGDSAHAQLPALGLGCSAAFADIEELCKRIDADGLSEQALRRYERWRMPQTAVLQTASRFTYGSMRSVGKLK